MKRIIVIFILVLSIILIIPLSSYAHSGRTDSRGGHKDNKNKSGLGYYHYHCGGNPAHLHKDGVCPYKNSSNYSYNNSSSQHTPSDKSSSNSSSVNVSKYWVYNRYWNGYKYVTGWQNIDGKLYCFDNDGFLYKNQWLKTESNEKYYIDSNGIMCVGWYKINNDYYYFNSNGIMLKGWNQINNNTYYLGKNGKMRTGLLKIDNYIYYFNNNGSMYTGWKTIDRNTYYFKSNGAASIGKVKIDGKIYNFDENGILETKTQQSNKTNDKLTWGMTPNEVIKVKNLSEYTTLNNLLYTTNHTINNCYMFDDDNKLCGYGKISAYSTELWFKFKTSLTEQDWKNVLDNNQDLDTDNPVYVSYYVKDSHLTMLVTDNSKIIQIRLSDSYANQILNT